ncbi:MULTISPECIES: hypothetical protein [Acidobacteriaceae]|uniref:DUF7544 domain-containing protein n=1 Tax=Acidobacteriaceae TaxID=204434 RepID=UPI00131CBF5B|nr:MULTISPECIES: hypothetical protein [Acidobacteriaceae]MDW5267784.1 hypothetical protein [Edaphobacter sp.]
MRQLSASEAINPAIQRTRTILFRPFRKGRSWKLAAVAYLSAMGLAFIPYPLIFFAVPRPASEQGVHFGLATAAFGLFTAAVLFLFFYLGSRLQFVLFAIAAEKSTKVAPLWKRYSSRTWPWLGLKFILSIVVTAIFATPIFYAFRSLITHMTIQPGQPPSPEMFASLFLFYVCLFAPIAILMLSSSLLSDFALPSIALEEASISEALGRFFQLIKAEPGQVLLYTIFKVLFAIAGMAIVQVIIMLAELVALIPFALLALLGWFMFRSLGPVGHLLLIGGGIMLGVAVIVVLFYIVIGVLGCAHMFYQNYALYFLGGRYPLLGDLLEPPAPDFPPPPLFPDLPPTPAGPGSSSELAY